MSGCVGASAAVRLRALPERSVPSPFRRKHLSRWRSLRRQRRKPSPTWGEGAFASSAGVTLAAVHRAAATAVWAYGVDFASRDRATVGGTVATNAGGLHVLRYGDTRAQVLGLEAVLGDGSVVSHLGGLVKDAGAVRSIKGDDAEPGQFFYGVAVVDDLSDDIDGARDGGIFGCLSYQLQRIDNPVAIATG